MQPEIWITGIGILCPLGEELASCIKAIDAGIRPQTASTIFPLLESDVPVCLVRAEHMHGWKREHSAADTLNMAHQAALDAFKMAGLSYDHSTGHNTGLNMGVCVGTTAGSALHFLEGYKSLKASPQGTSEKLNDVRAYFSSNLASGLAKKVNAVGPLLTITNACTSGTDALGIASNWLKLGFCDYALAGGSDALSIIPFIGFQRLMIYSSKPCKPFDKNRDGLNLGEGAAIFILERAEQAKARGAQPICALSGYGAAGDANHVTAPHSEGRGLRLAIAKAMESAGASPEDMAFISAHGTGTRENDKIESLVLSEMFPHIPIWATKGATGHCLGAAGAIEVALSAKALLQGCIPASTGLAQPEESVSKTLTSKAQTIGGEYALKVSLGFGGVNSALVLRRV